MTKYRQRSMESSAILAPHVPRVPSCTERARRPSKGSTRVIEIPVLSQEDSTTSSLSNHTRQGQRDMAWNQSRKRNEQRKITPLMRDTSRHTSKQRTHSNNILCAYTRQRMRSRVSIRSNGCLHARKHP